MNIDHLTRMANQIGLFFASMPDHAQATHDLAQHIKNFWEPRMRREFLQAVDHNPALELHPLVREALTEHRALMEPLH